MNNAAIVPYGTGIRLPLGTRVPETKVGDSHVASFSV